MAYFELKMNILCYERHIKDTWIAITKQADVFLGLYLRKYLLH